MTEASPSPRGAPLAGGRVRIEHAALNLAVGCDDKIRVVRSGETAG